MGSLIKEEFKGFIKELSVDISKEILIKEFTKINKDLNDTKIQYEEGYKKYSSLIDKLEKKLQDIEVIEGKLSREAVKLEVQNKNVRMLFNDVIIKFEENRKIEMTKIENQIGNNLLHLLDLAKTIEKKAETERIIMAKNNNEFKSELDKLLGTAVIEKELIEEIKGLKRNNTLILNTIKRNNNVSSARMEVAITNEMGDKEKIIEISENIIKEILKMKKNKMMCDGKFRYIDDREVIKTLEKIDKIAEGNLKENVIRFKESVMEENSQEEKIKKVDTSLEKVILNLESIKNEIDKVNSINRPKVISLVLRGQNKIKNLKIKG